MNDQQGTIPGPVAGVTATAAPNLESGAEILQVSFRDFDGKRISSTQTKRDTFIDEKGTEGTYFEMKFVYNYPTNGPAPAVGKFNYVHAPMWINGLKPNNKSYRDKKTKQVRQYKAYQLMATWEVRDPDCKLDLQKMDDMYESMLKVVQE